jgi:hypothetical protein
MKRFPHLFVFFSLGLFALSCSRNNKDENTESDFSIIRFDTQLYRYLTENKPDSTLNMFGDILPPFGKYEIHIGSPDSSGFFKRLQTFFSEPTLMKMYADEQDKFADIQPFTKELSYGLNLLLKEFPAIKRPKVYMHISGLNRNVIVTDEILSISADKYLGANYPLYEQFFYPYQRELMTPERIVPDYLLGFMMANFNFQGKDDVLLDKILYEGKLRFILSKLLPERNENELVAYTPEQYKWCKTNEPMIWKTILENQYLFESNYLVTNNFIRESPYTQLLSPDSPGRVGIYLGYRIISEFMKHSPETSLSELMLMNDGQEILKLSKYKPLGM